MSNFSIHKSLLQSFKEKKINLLSHTLGGLATAMVILMMPKDINWGVFRFGLTICFFTGLATALWGVTSPLEEYLKAELELKYDNFGPETRKLGYLWVDSVCRLLTRLAWLLLSALTFIFLTVLVYWATEWPILSSLVSFHPLFRFGYRISFLVVPIMLFFSTNHITEILMLRRIFKKHLEQSKLQPHTIEDAEKRELFFSGPAVKVTGPYRFEAGGIEWSWKDDFQKSTVVFGQIGSGKTITVLNALLDGLLSSASGQSGTETASALILDPKGDYFKSDKLMVLCQRLNRSKDLCILHPNQPEASIHWNPFDCPDDAGEISERFAGVLELLGKNKNTQDTFFIGSAKTVLQYSITLLRATQPLDSPPSFSLINDLITKPPLLEARLFIFFSKILLAELAHPDLNPKHLIFDETLRDLLNELKKKEHSSNLPILGRYFDYWMKHNAQIFNSIKDEVVSLSDELDSVPPVNLSQNPDFLLAAEYFYTGWASMPSRTRASVQAELTLMISPFLNEPYRSIFSGKSTFSMQEILDKGKILYVFMPSSGKQSEMSIIVNTLIKLEFYRQVLMQPRKTRPSLFFCDEFQAFYTSDERRGDTAFFAQSRESFHANIIATQNLAGLLMNASKEEAVDSLLGNCAVKIFLRNSEGKTNEYASKNIFGEYSGSVISVSRGISERGGKAGLGGSTNFTENTQILRRVPSEQFIHLAIPSESSGIKFAEALVALGSRAEFKIEKLKFKIHPVME